MAERKIIQPSCGAGRIECDGSTHFFVFNDAKSANGRSMETVAGTCQDPQACERMAAAAQSTRPAHERNANREEV